MAEARSIQLKRHCSQLSPVEVEELVATAADLIVDFLKGHEPKRSAKSDPDKELCA